ncbi:unnamed protein product [Nyctereutes procyonoides]|uniref:(raccoon dog) hypothetical protein n=1 Tax=Nyctereutes procyonoides TaxID=34880 RepID=A0A811XQ29_NYCPR|nr:unnamed protein product [Nyctereutes procyonoides]
MALVKEKREAAEVLIQEQLNLGHLKPSTSPWNTPIFVIKKKTGKWRLLQDLRAVNRVIFPMGTLQPGLPSPSAIPLNFQMLVLDLKDCFFTISLAPGDGEHFAFSLPSTNLQEPYYRYEWTVLPQGMVNSPTLCQEYVKRAIIPFRKRFPEVYCIHYMDDLLLAAEASEHLANAFRVLSQCLSSAGLQIAPEKVQREAPFEYLGYLISKQSIRPQKIAVRTSQLKTLNDFQKLLGDSSPSSLRQLTPEAEDALAFVTNKISSAQLQQRDLTKNVNLIILKPDALPMAVLWQTHGPLEWLHLAMHVLHVINPTISLISLLIARGRKRCIQLFGHEPHSIICPLLTASMVEDAYQTSLEWQTSMANFPGLSIIPTIFVSPISSQPIKDAPIIFPDASKDGHIAIVYLHKQHKNIILLSYKTKSVQRAELYAVMKTLEIYQEPFNLYSDSQYVARILPILADSFINSNDEELSCLFHKIQQLLLKRVSPIFVSHIRAHSGLPGPLASGNDLADRYAHLYSVIANKDPVGVAMKSHSLFHQNARSLRKQFHITREQARQIVKNCSLCPQYVNTPSFAINPRGLLPNDLWQMDVTHYSSFNKLQFVHVSIDTYSGMIVASAHSGESFTDVQNHLFHAFAYMGMPKRLKTDNGSVYISQAFKTFCETFHIQHTTGIPYNSTGQAIIERAHLTLKTTLQKLKKGEIMAGKMKYSPHMHLDLAIFILNFLIVHDDGYTPSEKHWGKNTDPPLMAKWKDPMTGQWKGPDPLLRQGRGYACIFPQDEEAPRWVPAKFVRDIKTEKEDESAELMPSSEEEDS